MLYDAEGKGHGQCTSMHCGFVAAKTVHRHPWQILHFACMSWLQIPQQSTSKLKSHSNIPPWAAILDSNVLQPLASTQPGTPATSPAHFFHPSTGNGVLGVAARGSSLQKPLSWMYALGSTSQVQQLSPALNASWRENSGALFSSNAHMKAHAVDGNWMCWMPTPDCGCESATSLSIYVTLGLKWWI